MKVIKDEMATLKRHRRVTVELLPGEQLLAINPKQYYELGEPLEDVVQGHIIADAAPVLWCPIGQEWIK